MPRLHVRTMKLDDAETIRRVELACYGRHAGSLADLQRLIADPNGGGVVAEQRGQLLGFLVHSVYLRSSECIFRNLAVLPHCRRLGVGTALASFTFQYGNPDRPFSWKATVPERCVSMQMLLRDLGFQCSLIIPDHFTITQLAQDGYVFTRYRTADVLASSN